MKKRDEKLDCVMKQLAEILITDIRIILLLLKSEKGNTGERLETWTKISKEFGEMECFCGR